MTHRHNWIKWPSSSLRSWDAVLNALAILVVTHGANHVVEIVFILNQRWRLCMCNDCSQKLPSECCLRNGDVGRTVLWHGREASQPRTSIAWDPQTNQSCDNVAVSNSLRNKLSNCMKQANKKSICEQEINLHETSRVHQ